MLSACFLTQLPTEPAVLLVAEFLSSLVKKTELRLDVKSTPHPDPDVTDEFLDFSTTLEQNKKGSSMAVVL